MRKDLKEFSVSEAQAMLDLAKRKQAGEFVIYMHERILLTARMLEVSTCALSFMPDGIAHMLLEAGVEKQAESERQK